jgi:hypothetical protein
LTATFINWDSINCFDMTFGIHPLMQNAANAQNERVNPIENRMLFHLKRAAAGEKVISGAPEARVIHQQF